MQFALDTTLKCLVEVTGSSILDDILGRDQTESFGSQLHRLILFFEVESFHFPSEIVVSWLTFPRMRSDGGDNHYNCDLTRLYILRNRCWVRGSSGLGS